MQYAKQCNDHVPPPPPLSTNQTANKERTTARTTNFQPLKLLISRSNLQRFKPYLVNVHPLELHTTVEPLSVKPFSNVQTKNERTNERTFEPTNFGASERTHFGTNKRTNEQANFGTNELSNNERTNVDYCLWVIFCTISKHIQYFAL